MKGKQGEEQVKEEVFLLKALTHKQLAQMYGVSWLTFQNWIKKVEHEVGRKTGHFYHVHHDSKFFCRFFVVDVGVIVHILVHFSNNFFGNTLSYNCRQ